MTDITDQLLRASAVIERHLGSSVQAIHLFGSALDGGLKPHSDLDLLVTVSRPLDEATRRALMLDLLNVSAPLGGFTGWRPLEVTVVAHGEVAPWRYPARRELQFGEWLRQDLQAGVFEPAMPDHDLAILLTKARQRSVALSGPSADTFFQAVPAGDFAQALAETIAQWRSVKDWAGDERNTVLALARIWYSAATGRIVPKDVAATWVLEGLPPEHRQVMQEARAAYLGQGPDRLALRVTQLEAFIRFARSEITALLHAKAA